MGKLTSNLSQQEVPGELLATNVDHPLRGPPARYQAGHWRWLELGLSPVLITDVVAQSILLLCPLGMIGCSPYLQGSKDSQGGQDWR